MSLPQLFTVYYRKKATTIYIITKYICANALQAQPDAQNKSIEVSMAGQ